MLAHSVFFSLHDKSLGAIAKQIEACKAYLPNHPGILYFLVGTLNQELRRPVSDCDFDIALHLLFDSQASHDAYQVAPMHKQFIQECEFNWSLVRVFDSDVESK